MYSLPAGHVDGNETIQVAMSREAKEEINIDILPEDLSILHMMHRKSSDSEYMDFFFEAKKFSGKLKIMKKINVMKLIGFQWIHYLIIR